MKLMIEGLPDEIDDFLSELYGSVPQPAHQEKDIEDRISRLERVSSEIAFANCEFADEVLDGIKNLEATVSAGDGLDALYCGTCHCSPCRCPDSVPPGESSSDQDPDRKPTKDSLFVPAFEWKPECEKSYKNLNFAELPDGRVMLNYFSARVFTTKEKIMQLPFPIPRGFLKLCGSPNTVTAIIQYRKYLAKHSVHAGAGYQGPQQDRKEKDLDEPFKPKLKGVFSTHPGKEDFDKVEGTLEA